MTEHQAAATRTEAGGAPETGPPIGRVPVILIVDDEVMARTSLTGRLKKLGYRLIEAADGRQGLEMAMRHRPDLIIVDWIMPELDGPSFCEAVKADASLRGTHLIMMTSNDQPQQIAEGLARGADDYLSKGASTQEIFARVQAGLRSFALVKQLQEARDHLDHSYRLLHRKQEELESELRSAAQFVASLLPAPGRPASGLELAWEFLPSLALGGDLFNVTPWGDGLCGLYILDASGHGVSAALRAASLTTFLRADSLPHQVGSFDPGRIVTEMNRRFPLSPEGDYFTIWVGCLDLRARALSFCTAGHAGALLVQENGETRTLCVQALPLGFQPDTVYATHHVALRPGDRLFLFSDGLYEAQSATGECWGQERLTEALRATRGKALARSIEDALTRARRWQQGEHFRDDAALVGLELSRGPGPEPDGRTEEAGA